MLISGRFGNIRQKIILPPDYANVLAHYRFNSGITITGQGASKWVDEKNGHDLLQSVDADRPPQLAGGELDFDGTSDFMVVGGTWLNQNWTIFILMKHNTWTISNAIFDGTAGNSGALLQTPSTPDLRVFAGNFGPTNSDFPLATYWIASCQYAGATSSLRHNKDTAITTGDSGPGNPGGFKLGKWGGAGNFSDITVKEIVIYTGTKTIAQEDAVIDYLSDVGGLGL